MCTNPQETADLITLTKEILNDKLYILCLKSTEVTVEKQDDVMEHLPPAIPQPPPHPPLPTS